MFRFLSLLSLAFFTYSVPGQTIPGATLTAVDSGQVNPPVNTVTFRKNALVTFKDIQYTAFYDNQQFVLSGKRKTGGTNRS